MHCNWRFSSKFYQEVNIRYIQLSALQVVRIADPQVCLLTHSNITFTSQGAMLLITHTKTIQFCERQLEIPLPHIPGSPLCPVIVLQIFYSYHLVLFYLFVNRRMPIGLSWLTSIRHLLRHRSRLLESIECTIPQRAFVEEVRHLLSAVKHLQHLLF